MKTRSSPSSSRRSPMRSLNLAAISAFALAHLGFPLEIRIGIRRQKRRTKSGRPSARRRGRRWSRGPGNQHTRRPSGARNKEPEP